jgi:hypothetical protein
VLYLENEVPMGSMAIRRCRADQHILGILLKRDIVPTLAHNAPTAGGFALSA